MAIKTDKEKIWKDVLESLKVSVSGAIYSTWISHTQLISLRKIDDKRYMAEIGCPSAFIKNTVEKRYFGLVQDTLIKCLGSPADLTFEVKQIQQDKKPEMSTPLFEERNESEEYMRRLGDLRIRPGFTFENFAVSGSNQMAHAAAEAVATNPGTSYNPLFIWGGVGVGKTHLMHAVAHTLIKHKLETKIVICTGEDFTNDIVEGIRNKTTQRVREKYRKVNALFIDDIQFIAGKDAVQNEFFHTFNAVTGAGGQIILTADKPPGEITYLEDRLISRFEAGLVVDVGPPDFELRCAICQIKAQEKGLDLDTTQIQLIAGNIDTARKIEGYLIKLMSEIKTKNLEITEDLITSLFAKKNMDANDIKHKVSADNVMDAVCTHYSVSKRALMGKTKARIIARPRQVLMYLLRTELQLPLEEVGKMIGGRDHTTVMHAVDKISQLASMDVDTREDILRIRSNF
jgi:chromosomal replication initiator protein